MPLYTYENPDSGEVKEVVQAMLDKHVYFDAIGQQWNRVFSSPRAAVDTKVNPFSQKDFLRHTNKNMTVGQIMDVSAEMSDKRANKAGVDPVKKGVFDRYKNSTGKEHPLDRPKKIETKNFTLEL